MNTIIQLNNFSLRKKLFLLSLIIGTIIWCIGISFPFFFFESNSDLTKFILKIFYSNVCHQNESKLIFINGNHFLVCARCTGIYFGVLFSILSFPLLKNSLYKITTSFLSLAFLLMISDVLFYQIGIYSYSKIISFSTGIIFSLTLTFFVLNYFLIKEKKYDS